MTSAILSVTNVIAGYDSAIILHGVSVQVVRGSVTALLGSNGAGKTTLMKTIVGLLELAGARLNSMATMLVRSVVTNVWTME